MTDETPTYELAYWPFLPGRGEYVRLLFEEAATSYVDVARLPESEGGGVAAVERYRSGDAAGHPAFAPPILRAGNLVIAQVANICLFLGRRLQLVPRDEHLEAIANQLQLTIADLVGEVHDTHHPLGVSMYYEDQEEAARQRSKLFVEERLPRFLGYFERVLERNDASSQEFLVGSGLTYVDLSLFQTLRGLEYAFPRAYAKEARRIPLLLGLRDRVASRPRIDAYLASERCLPFNEHGIFRHYPQLDLE
jgi:glutathione S-transferase